MDATDTGRATETPRAAAWYARSPEEVAARFEVDPAASLSTATAAELLERLGPNALPAEKSKPEWRRFLDEYRSYMQIIPLAADTFSIVIGQFHTGVMVLVLTVINAVVGLREEGKAESAMNALKSMMKATARVRRDGAGSEIPAEGVVAGDVVLLAAGDQVPADGRIVAANALQIDESALTGESVPAAKDAAALSGTDLGPGDQSDMAFMNTPVTHGSGVMIVTGTGAATEVGKIAGMLSATKVEQTPLTQQLNRMTLWIGAAAGVTMIVMFALGALRGQAWDALFVTAIASAMGLTAFAACRIVGCFESRNPTESIVKASTLDSRQLNWIALFEVVLMILVVGLDMLNRWLGTASMTWTQWGLALAPAGALFVLWELGKLIARHEASRAPAAEAAQEAHHLGRRRWRHDVQALLGAVRLARPAPCSRPSGHVVPLARHPAFARSTA